MDTRRRIDLCTCGKPREDAVHGERGSDSSVITLGPLGHAFMPNPQPPPLLDPAAFHRIHALRLNGVWVAEVYGTRKKVGRGQAALWADAVNAAIEDLKEKTS